MSKYHEKHCPECGAEWDRRYDRGFTKKSKNSRWLYLCYECGAEIYIKVLKRYDVKDLRD